MVPTPNTIMATTVMGTATVVMGTAMVNVMATATTDMVVARIKRKSRSF